MDGFVTEKTQKNNEPSIFLHKDSNNNNIVDEEDFGGNEAVVEIVQRNGWLGKAWDKVGEALNLLLKHVSIDKKDTKSVEDVLNAMVENVDLNNYSEITAVLTAIGNEASRKGSIGYDSEKRDAYYQKLFKGNFESFGMYRDGGSKEIKLKDGTTIYQNFSMSSPRNERGQFTVTKSDGTVEYYDDEGKAITKQIPEQTREDYLEGYKMFPQQRVIDNIMKNNNSGFKSLQTTDLGSLTTLKDGTRILYNANTEMIYVINANGSKEQYKIDGTKVEWTGLNF